MEVLLETAEDWGEQVRLELVWDAIENVVSRAELRAAVARIVGGAAAAGRRPGRRVAGASCVERLAAVRGFVPLLCRCIDFGATRTPRRCWPR